MNHHHRKTGLALHKLYDRIAYWLYVKNSRSRAAMYTERFARLLAQYATPDDEAIQSQAYWSLLAEARGDIAGAIRHKSLEIAAITKCLRIAGPVEYVDHEFLADTYVELAWLHVECDDLTSAKSALASARQLLAQHGLSDKSYPMEKLLK